MEDLKFEITSISRERSINGKTVINAICKNDNTDVRITLQHYESDDKDNVKTKLTKEYNRLIEIKNDKSIKIGDVI